MNVTRILQFSLGLAFAGTNLLGAQAGERFVDARADSLQELLNDRFADSVAGMVIGLLDEEGSRIVSVGKLGDGTSRPVDADTVFKIASVTKVFTSLLLLDAARRGELDLNDPLAKHLPDDVRVPSRNDKEITLLNLASQDSGLPFTSDETTSRGRINPDAQSAEDLYFFLSRYELSVDPGAGFEYSNLGMALLGLALEHRLGASYESLVVKRICEPLGMDSTRIELTPEMRRRLAIGHDEEGRPVTVPRLKAMASAGALYSSVGDLLRFLSAQLGFIETPLATAMHESQEIRHRGHPRFGKTATPWFDQGVYNPPGSEILAHGGTRGGYLSFLGLDTIKRRGVVILTNQRSFDPMGLGWTLLQELPLTEHNITNWVREIVGLGVALGVDDDTGDIVITGVFSDSSAGEAGLSAGLVIDRVNGVSVHGRNLQECLRLMAGSAGTKVELRLIDPGNPEARTVELTKRKFLTVE